MDKLVKTPTVTFRYPLSTKIQLNNEPTSYSKLVRTLTEANDFLKKEEILKSDHALLQRLVYKFNSQLRHFKSFKNLKRINQYLTKFQTFFAEYSDESSHLRECCNQEQNAIFLPSRQMLEYYLAKSMQLSFVLRKVVLFCMNTFHACLSSIHRAELTGAHLIFCSLSSRIWIIARTVILKLVDWYADTVGWLPHLKGSESDCLNGFVLTEGLMAWLNSKCPVDDDPTVLESKPIEADDVLARFAAGEEEEEEEKEVELEREGKEETGQESAESQGESTGSETDIIMAVARKTRAQKSRTQLAESAMQAEISQPGTSSQTEDLGVAVKRKIFHSEEQGRDSPRYRETSEDDLGVPVKRRKSGENGNANSEPKPSTSKKRKIKNGNSETTNGATAQPTDESNSKETNPKPESSNGVQKAESSNGVFAVPAKRGKTRKAQSGLSKVDYKKAMKCKLKKPARFLEELSHSSMEIGNELIVLPRTSRQKLHQELTVLLREFDSKKKQVAKQPEGQKTQILKQVKKLRLAFKHHARDSLWNLMQKK